MQRGRARQAAMLLALGVRSRLLCAAWPARRCYAALPSWDGVDPHMPPKNREGGHCPVVKEMDAAIRRGDMAKIPRIFDAALAAGDVPVGTGVFNRVLKACSRVGDAEAATQTFHTMVAMGVNADDMTHVHLIKALCRAGLTAEADRHVDGMGGGAIPALHNATVYTRIDAGDTQGARERLKVMRAAGVAGDEATWALVLRLEGMDGSLESIEEAWCSMKDTDVPAGIRSLLARAIAISNKGTIEDAVLALRDMVEEMEGEALDEREARSIRTRMRVAFQAVLQRASREAGEEALASVVELMNKAGDTESFTSQIFSLTREARRRRQSVDPGRVAAVVGEMRAMGVPLGAKTYEALLQAYATAGDVRAAMQALTEAHEDGVPIGSSLYTGAIWVCAAAGDTATALQLFEGMRRDGAEPSTYTYAGLFKAMGGGALAAR